METAIWWDELKSRTNPAFRRLYFAKTRYLVLMGGGGSGKSIFAGDKVLSRVTCEAGHRWLVCRKVARTMRESVFRQIVSQAKKYPRADGLKVNKSEMMIEFPNGSQIIFAGLDDVEKLKSIYSITGIWVEEASEITESDFNQLDIRLRGETPYYKQIILTFNPVSVTHWLKSRFFDREDENATIHHSTYRDNIFLDEDSARVLESYKDTDRYYYTVYCLGEWGVTGNTVFDAGEVTARLQAIRSREKPDTGIFEYEYDGRRIENARGTRCADGYLKLYRPPEEGVPYVIGADTSGDGSDWFVAQVLNNVTGEQVAVLRQRLDEDVFARQLYCLGRLYNDALIGVEANFSTYPIKELERLGYQKLYLREQEDTYTGEFKRSFGFRTDAITRPVIIAGLIQAMHGGIGLINDVTTLLEMLSFVRNARLRPEAEAGAHDDCVMALAIAYYIRPQQTMLIAPPAKEKWSRSQWEDYENADTEERKYLIKKWGKPASR
ncbi:MAG: PBSX family phage terminase large subunit [Oscillospiraceae bacterium]|nr:PBSX family phage terminase large subunit [Oscillospiraceae bacterium]